LALALAVMETRRVPADAKAMIGIVATSFVLYTLFAHGLTLRPLIGLLGLNRLSPRELAVRNRAMALALADSREHVRAVAEEHDLSHGVRDEAEAQFGGRLGTLEQSLETDCALDEDARMEMGLVTLAGREERLYLGLLDENLVSRQVVQRLRAIAGRLGDGARSAGRDGYLRAAVAALDHAQGFRFAIWASRHLRWHRPLRSLLSQRFEMLMASRVVLRDLVNFAENRLGALLGAAYAGRIVAVLNDRRFAVEQALEALRQQFPDYARGLERGYVGRAALRQELAAYRALHEEGVISQDVLNDLEREVGHRWRVFEMVPTLDLGLDAARLVARVPMFAGLGAASLQNIARHLRPGLAMPDEVLVRRGERGEEMYFVASGEVEVRNPDTLPQPIRLGAGDFFGELALLTRQPRSADVVALTYCQLLVLDRRAVTQLFREDPSLRDHIRAVAQNRMAAERAAE
ncbi:MAG TPA: cyclic nucleotide-binding domain-containing protein, partial [Alphaproteobacteria bacterium]|nr:cyclic nucleotide-binding domain-containing protein [Alphaproteobacteria bacterium]